METKGIILFNRGEKMIIRAIVCLNSLRKHFDGNVTMYLEQPYPIEFDEVCKDLNIDIFHNEEKPEIKTLARKTEMFMNPPYDRTLWIDTDTILLNKIDEMFDYLDEYDVAIPHFVDWWSNGRTIAKRINRFEGIANDKFLKKALQKNPAVNTGVLSFKKSEKWSEFVLDWVDLANKGFKKKIFISDEVAFQILYPSIEEWGLKCFIAPSKFNTSVKFGEKTEDKRVLHFHGSKHCIDYNLCNVWKNEFEDMKKKNTVNINSYLSYANYDKRLKKYLNFDNDVTIVTACDPKYVEILKYTFPNWRKYKGIDKHPVIVFYNGMAENDKRLDFLRLPNVKLIHWDMENASSHREKMLSAFVFGTAENVETDYWLKIDADSFATDYRPFITDEMKKYAFCGHKWGYSRVEHIKQLDEWAKSHWKRKLKKAKPMINEGRIEGSRFYHKTKRTISFIQLHKTRFTKFCVKLLKERKLPAPTQDTYMFYVANRFDPETVGIMNFKRNYGFTQGNGKRIEDIKKKLDEIDKLNIKNAEIDEEIDEEEDYVYESEEKVIDYGDISRNIGLFIDDMEIKLK